MPKTKKKPQATSLQRDVELLNRWVDEVYGLNKLVLKKLAGKLKGPIPRPYETPIAQEILERDDESAAAAAKAYILKLEIDTRERVCHEFLHTLGDRLFRRPLPFDASDLVWLIKKAARTGDFFEWPLAGIVAALERHVRNGPLSPTLQKATIALQKNIDRRADRKADRDLIQRLTTVRGAKSPELRVDAGEPWARRLQKDVAAMRPPLRERWTELLIHAQSASATKPAPSWLAAARRLVGAIGRDEIAMRVAVWFPLFAKPRTDKPWPDLVHADEKEFWPWFVNTPNELLLKGLIWCCQAVGDGRNRPVLVALRNECNRETIMGKRFIVGATACLRALEALPS